MATFDDRMKARLLAFQQANGLPGGGVADAKTWELLSSSAPAKAAATEPPQQAQRSAVVLSPEKFPLTCELVSVPPTVDGVLDFLAAHGCDVRAVVADMDRILAAEPTD